VCKVILGALGGAILGMVLFVAMAYAFWQVRDFYTLLLYGLGGLPIGVLLGIIWGLYQSMYLLSQKILQKRRNVVVYKPARCAWCKGSGIKTFFFIPRLCGACGGYGSILVAEKSPKCAKCRGTGKGTLSRCEVCDGTGWAHSGIDPIP
jgi:hypothetical protein